MLLWHVNLFVFEQDDIRCVRKDTEKTGAEKRNLTTKIEELSLFNDTSDKELKKLRLKKQVPLNFPLQRKRTLGKSAWMSECVGIIWLVKRFVITSADLSLRQFF